MITDDVRRAAGLMTQSIERRNDERKRVERNLASAIIEERDAESENDYLNFRACRIALSRRAAWLRKKWRSLDRASLN